MKKLWRMVFAMAVVGWGVLHCTTAIGQSNSAYQKRLDNWEGELQAVSQVLAHIEKTGNVSPDVEEQLDAAFDRSGETAWQLFKEQHEGLDKVAKNPSKEALAAASAFDEAARRQFSTLNKLIKRMKSIDLDVINGKIKVSEATIRRMDPERLLAFRQSLSTHADQWFQNRYPDRFGPHASTLGGRASVAIPLECVSLNNKNSLLANSSTSGSTLFDGLIDVIVPSAHANVAEYCVGICTVTGGTACAGCVALGGVAAYSAYKAYQQCKPSCGRCKWYKPWSCACRAACLAAFIYVLGA